MERILFAVVVILMLGTGTAAYSQQAEIPSWVKSTAGLWADGDIPDEGFVNAIEFLIGVGVIQVDDSAPFDTELADDYDELYDDYNALYDDYDELADACIELADDYDELYDDYNALYDDYDELYEYYDEIYPLTTISGTEVSWEFYDSKENFYRWSMPIATYENQIPSSREYSLYQYNVNPHTLTLDGYDFIVPNFDGFVLKSFDQVIDDIYDNSHSNLDFVYEVWYVVSQLTVYDKDVRSDSEGRYALETFTRTGGDCEDLVILIADMLMSSSHTRHWDFQYVYMDLDNPSDPQTMNHVILYVYDGQYDYFIEATAPPSWDYFPDGVTGWWFDVV